jgi:ABC-2 type transport system ATP-binding protein
MDLLTVENVSKQYTGHKALDDVSLSVPEGKIYGLLGPNGAGKTTLIRIINHITAPDSGRVIFNGHQLTDNDLDTIGYLPEERGLYKKMKVGEQSILFAQLKGLSRREAEVKLRQWFDRLEISSWWDKKVEELSKGMAQKIQFVITVLHEPKLLIFDEPFSGFDPINADVLKKEILKLRDNGATVIFSTHDMNSVEELCDNMTLINNSHNILSGSVADIKAAYATGRYELTFAGETQSVVNMLSPMLNSHVVYPTENGRTRVSVQLTENTSLRELIATANQYADLRGVSESIPSINDIFIKAVTESNK